MTFKITFGSSLPAQSFDTVMIPVTEGNKTGTFARQYDKDHGGAVSAFLAQSRNFKGGKGQIRLLGATSKKGGYDTVILAGTGKVAALTADDCETLGGKIFQALKNAGAVQAVIALDDIKGLKKIKAHEAAAHIAAGIKLASYRFLKYRTKKADKDEPDILLKKILILCAGATDARAYHNDLDATVQGVFLARDLVNEPPNALYPDSFAALIKKELAPLGVAVDVMDRAKMEKIGFHAHIAVGKGSERQPCVVVMRWNGTPDGKAAKGKDKGKRADKSGNAPVALVGKGITFDTGGINIKPSAGMEEMKMDMGGAAAVVGAMKAIALRKAKANVTGIVGLAENMPSHVAYRPSDIIDSLSGQTIEVLNTDAEGRLVLADCLTYIQQTEKPCAIVDLATLTGAMLVALGHEYCGTFVNNDALWKKIEKAGADGLEKIWRMPLDEAYKKEMVSQIADVRSLGNGRFAGACTAAGFLAHFVDDKTPWAHMDIAGTAWIKSDRPTCPKYATGFGVRTLDRLIAQYES